METLFSTHLAPPDVVEIIADLLQAVADSIECHSSYNGN
jgi:hypothetical protein